MTGLEMRDVVFAVGRRGAERVLLRGANLRVADGEVVFVSGVDSEARASLTALLAGRKRPHYGTIVGGRGTYILDAGDHPPTGTITLPAAVKADAVLVLGGSQWEGRTVSGPGRAVRLDGGQFVDIPRPTPAVRARMPLDELRRRSVATLRAAGVEAAQAELTAKVLVDAERRGHRSHGIALLPTYLRRISEGGIDVSARPRLTESTATIASVDAGGGLGQPAAEMAAQWCAATAAKHGVAVAAVHDNNHVGMLAAYRNSFQDNKVIALILNTSGPSVAAPGAMRPTLGSNAICLVTPSGEGPEPFCVDMATGVVAAGKIRDAANRGVPVREGWLQDASGAPTTDPHDLDRGGSIPLFGDYKGLCVTLLAEILGGALAGGRVSPDVAKQRKQLGEVMRCSQLFIGFAPGFFPLGDDPQGLTGLVNRLREAVLAGHDTEPARPWFPDQLEEDHAAQVDELGVEVPKSVLAELGWTHS
jgi:LDH2 family malate/lactate/ureidoglycolate dehydrogenase